MEFIEEKVLESLFNELFFIPFCNATFLLLHEIGTLNLIRCQFSSFFPVLDPNMLSCTLFAWWSLSYPSSGLKTEKSVNYERGVYEKYVLLC